MLTIEVRTTKIPADPAERCIPLHALKDELVKIRGQNFSKETFRTWRKTAGITNKCWYCWWDFIRLEIVVKHLREGGCLKDTYLKVLIQVQKDKEKTFKEAIQAPAEG